MKATAWTLLLVLSALGMPLFAQPGEQDEFEGKIVKEIEFIGADLASPESVTSRMKTKKGQPLRRAELNDDLKTLREELHLFATASIKFVAYEGGVKIQFFVAENPRIGALIFTGYIDLSREELLQEIDSREGGLADDITLQLDQKRIQDKYLKEGYHFVQVQYRKLVEETTTVIFDITEGPKVTIERVDFIGNATFEKSELLEAMPTTDEGGFLSSTKYVEKDAQADIVNLGRFYYGKGFLDAKVTLVDRTFSLDKEEVFLTIKVEEGNPYLIRSITFLDMKRVDEEKFRAEGIKSRVGDRYEQSFKLLQDIQSITRAYHDQAFIDVDVINETKLPIEGYEVDVVLRIDEQQRTRVGDVKIEGNIETQDRVIRRLLDDLVPGAPFNLNTFKRAQNRIINLRYFAPTSVSLIKENIGLADFEPYRNVFVTVEETDKPNIKNILVQVEEVDTGSIKFSVGVNSNAGLVGAIVYRKDNFDPLDFPESFDDILDAFTGGGQTLEIGFYPGVNLTQFQISYTHPFVFDSEYDLNLVGFRRVRVREEWDENRLGFNVAIGRRVGFNIALSLRYRFEYVDVNDLQDRAPQIVYDYEGERLISSLTFGARIADLDNYLQPAEGYRVNLQYEFAGLGGDVDFHRISLEGAYYLTLATDAEERKHVLFFTGHFGYVKEHGDSGDVPIYERLFAGGQNSIRGFEFRGVGPMENDTPIGGKALITGSVNYGFPLYEQILGGVLFLDVGTLAPELDSEELFDFRASVGFGIRLKIDFLGPAPFAIDFGFPLVKYRDDQTQIISFTLDRQF
ncbi:MAG: outer membrane protein assembly factor BamA [Planctomycetes bacterium]|nr:outer membrane protein assembly factor BamA [Planctomycetota bacterium]